MRFGAVLLKPTVQEMNRQKGKELFDDIQVDVWNNGHSVDVEAPPAGHVG